MAHSNSNSKTCQILVQRNPDCHFAFPDELKLKDLASLIGLGIKLFLYQRGQIPVPFESLHSSPQEFNHSDECFTSLKHLTIPEKITNPKQRLQYLKQKRASIRMEKQVIKRKKIEIANEFKARTTLESAFQVFEDIFSSISLCDSNQSYDAMVVILMFGLSVFNPKECIVFNLDQGMKSINPNSKSLEDDLLHKITKKFYKNVITSPTFGDFVSNRLRETSSHLTLMTDKPLSEKIISKYALHLIENFKVPLSNNNCEKTSSTHARSQPSVFHINLRHENNPESYFSNTLSKYYPYRIPMSFRGVRKVPR